MEIGQHPSDPSSEKARRAKAAAQIAIWAESRSWEGPLLEYARLSTTEKSPDELVRRLRFFRWEVTATVDREFNSTLKSLNDVFFQKLGFRRCTTSNDLDSVIAKRQATPALLAMLYAWVAELFLASHKQPQEENSGGIGSIEIVNGTPTDVVRVISPVDDGRLQLIDLGRSGEPVAELDWVPWCETAPAGFTKKTFPQALTTALTELFLALDRPKESDIEILTRRLSVLDAIIALQPSETSRWAERAVLNSRLGFRTRALDDLKRFFAFHEKETAPAAIISLFDELRNGRSDH